MRVRGPAIAVLALLVAGCATTPKKPAPARAAVAAPATKPAPPRSRWQARKVVPDAETTPQGRVHVVKPGETGIAIAIAYGVKWDRIVALNKLKPPYVLEVGDRLRLPSARQVAAQTPEERARAFSLDIDDLITGSEPAIEGQLVAAAPPAPRPPRSSAPRPSPAAPRAAPRANPNPSAPAVAIGDAPPFRWPVDGRVLSAFGAKPGGRFNDGVNLKASAGAPVRAAADGVVAYAGDAIPGFGNLVLIKHAGGWVTAYGHAEAVLVARGARVSTGDVIARAGSTGAVSEPQVHFEIRRGRTPVNPARVIGGQ
ncbi:murein DD-endopeptidase MepM/ murein hydrolase activator NlpD [Polymorphobacter fuscus]|uniref:M23 family metallopeptidase n=1 Tax=Sandarakinorhabdus fusca TaxID=1439888 RepID=UPI00142FF3EC|nr:M23 family metallopeptidase [Polymorphobacter fuscus]NJC09739.1 murein DD-endopeptidase MepM/ murein hydrolase activator NlpD [Polymorphobacter fuscus]